MGQALPQEQLAAPNRTEVQGSAGKINLAMQRSQVKNHFTLNFTEGCMMYLVFRPTSAVVGVVENIEPPAAISKTCCSEI